jgi:hypothetical protein
MRILAHLAISRSPGFAPLPLDGPPPHDRNHAQFLQQGRIEGNLVHPVDDLARGTRRPRTLDRVDLHQHGIARVTLAHQRRDGGIAGETAVPIRLTVDLYRLIDGRQATRSEQHVRRKLGVAEHPAAAGAHIGCGDEQPDRGGNHAVKIDTFDQDVPQRVAA